MTPVEFTFVTPNGLPIAEAPIQIQLLKSGYDPAVTGVIMPRPVIVDTDAQGKATVPLQPSNVAYVVTVFDSESDTGLSYKFYVPVLTPPNTSVRLQDIIVDLEMSSTTYDETALLLINSVKANVLSAYLNIQNIQTDVTDKIASIAASVASAASFAGNSSTSATNSSTSADAAALSATAANTSAGNAATSATAASTSAGTAAGRATAAATSAGDALTQAGNALTQAGNAATAATNANTAKGLAETARNQAQGFAGDASTSAGNAHTSEINAAASAGAAAGSATTANTAKADAVAAATLAQKWATQTGTAVEGALLSAKAYAEQAATAAQGAVQGQINSDWLVTDPAQKAYINNKPVLAPVATAGTYASLTAKPTIPAKTSDLVNDAGFITSASLPSSPVISVAGRTGTVTLASADVGLANVNNTSDLNKPISTATQAVLDTKAAITYVDQKVADLVASSPAALDTLSELASALGNDAAFSTTVTTALGKRLRFDAAQMLTAQEKINAKTSLGFDQVNNTADVDKPVSTAAQTALNAKQDSAAKNATNGYAGLNGYSLIIKDATGNVLSKLTSIAGIARNWNMPDKDGTVALLSDVANAGITIVTGPTTMSTGNYVVPANYALTLPDLSNPVNISITNPGNGVTATSTLTTNDGWSVQTGFVAGTTKEIAPVAFGSKRGWWGSLAMTPPVLSTVTAAASVQAFTPSIISSVVLDNGNIVVLTMNNTIPVLLVINPTTGAMTMNTGLPVLTNMFLLKLTNNTIGIVGNNPIAAIGAIPVNSGVVYAGTVAGTVITWGAPARVGTLSGGSYVVWDACEYIGTNSFVIAYGVGFYPIYVGTVSGTTVTMQSGAGVTLNDEANIYNNDLSLRLTKVSATRVLATYFLGHNTPSNSGSYIQAVTITLTTPTTVTFSATATNSGANYFWGNDRGNMLIPFGPTAHLFVGSTAYNASTSSLCVIDVSGAIPVFSNTVVSSWLSTVTRNRPQIYPNAYAQSSSMYGALLTPTKMLCAVTGGNTRAAIAEWANNVLSFTVQSGPDNVTLLSKDSVTGNTIFGLNSVTSTFTQLASNGVYSPGPANAGYPASITSATLNDVSWNIGGIWYAWNGVPTNYMPVSPDKYLNLSAPVSSGGLVQLVATIYGNFNG